MYKVDQAGKEDGTEVIQIHEQYPNPQFDWNTAQYDQMLILLSRPASNNWPVVKMNFNPTIPTSSSSSNADSNNKITVIGNGVIDRNTHFPSVLQSLTVDYLPNFLCKALSGMWQVNDDMVCVTGDGTSEQSQCSGDSGGPYLILGDSYKTDLLIATVSWYVRFLFFGHFLCRFSYVPTVAQIKLEPLSSNFCSFFVWSIVCVFF